VQLAHDPVAVERHPRLEQGRRRQGRRLLVDVERIGGGSSSTTTICIVKVVGACPRR
jgi:hypothetical protein